jgi:glutathione S-transferase
MSHPDSNVHASATGAAAQTVSSHSAPISGGVKLYSGWFCPFVQRVWLILEEKNIPYQYIEVNPYNKPQSLLSLNPRGLVPTLEYEGKPLYESTVICEFLEEVYGEKGEGSLLPADPYEKARCRISVDFCTSRIIPGFHRFLQFQPLSETKGLEGVRNEFLGYLKTFTKEMHDNGPFFLGKEPSLVDFIVAPWAVRNLLSSQCKPC